MAGVNRIREKAKNLWLKGMETVGNAAASIASNTKLKVDEVTLQNRRREVMNDLAGKTYTLWLKGVRFPDELNKMLNELQELDDQLNDMRAAKYALSDKGQAADTLPEKNSDETEDKENDSISINPAFPVSNEINGLFDNTVSVGQMAKKVNSSLDQMSDCIRRFPQGDETEHEEEKQE